MAGQPIRRAREALEAAGGNPDDIDRDTLLDDRARAQAIKLETRQTQIALREAKAAAESATDYLKRRYDAMAELLADATEDRIAAGSDQIIIHTSDRIMGRPTQAVKVQQDPAGLMAELGASILARAAAEGLLLPAPIDTEEPNP